ncbi:MAG: hypothetical protein ACTSRL_21630 [Candidatus Helarchaeota archaeon]
MVLDFFQVHPLPSQDELHAFCHHFEVCELQPLVRYGVSAQVVLIPALASLQKELQLGYPVVVRLQAPHHHSVLAVGYEAARDQYYIHDPAKAEGYIPLSAAELRAAWQAGEPRGIIVRPVSEVSEEDATPGMVQRTLSTSLRIPRIIRQKLEEQFPDKAVQRRLIGFYERIFALGVKELCRKAGSYIDCETFITPVYEKLFEGFWTFYNPTFRNRYAEAGAPGLTDQEFIDLLKDFPLLKGSVEWLQELLPKVDPKASLYMEVTSEEWPEKGWPRLVLQYTRLKKEKRTEQRLCLPPRSYGELRQWLAFLFRRGAEKLQDSVLYTIFNTFRQMRTVQKKLRQFQEVLTYESYYDLVGSYLLTGYLPYYLRAYLAEMWGVSVAWVRDLTFGWRRKLDRWLPDRCAGFRMHPVAEQTQKLLVAVRTVLTEIRRRKKLPLTPKDRYVLRTLAKRHLLHRLLKPGAPDAAIPNGLIKQGKRRYLTHARKLQQKLATPAVWEQIGRLLGAVKPLKNYQAVCAIAYPTHFTLTLTDLDAAAQHVQEKYDHLISQKQEMLTRATGTANESALEASIDALTTLRETVRFFRETVLPRLSEIDPPLDLFDVVLPASRQFRTLATILERIRLPQRPAGALTVRTVLKRQLDKYRLVGMFGAIVTRACLTRVLRPGESVKTFAEEIAAELQPDRLLTRPFCSDRRPPQKLLPLELQMSKEFVIYRSETPRNLTDRLRAELERLPPEERRKGRIGVLLGLPRRKVRKVWEQLRPVVSDTLTDKQLKTFETFLNKVLDDAKHQFSLPFAGLPMEAPLTPKMEQWLLTTASNSSKSARRQSSRETQYLIRFTAIRLLPPRPASLKVVANLLFEGPPAAFIPGVNFWKARPRERGQHSDPKPTPPALDKETKAAYTAPEADLVLGCDLNRNLTRWTLACATPEAPIDVEPYLTQVAKLTLKLRRWDWGKIYAQLTAELSQVPDPAVASLLREGRQKARIQNPLQRQEECLQIFRQLGDRFRQAGARTLLTQIRAVKANHEKGLYVELRHVQRAISLWERDLAALVALEAEGKAWKRDPEFAAVRRRILHRYLRTNRTLQNKAARGQSDPRWSGWQILPELKRLVEAKLRRLRPLLTLLHQRKGNLKAARDRELELALSRILLALKAGVLGVEDLQLTTRGAGRWLAKVVTDMAKCQWVTEEAVQRVNAYHRLYLGNGPHVEYRRVNPRGTSTFCAQLVNGKPCNERLRRSPLGYDYQICPIHGELNRHQNSAMAIAQRAQTPIRS